MANRPVEDACTTDIDILKFVVIGDVGLYSFIQPGVNCAKDRTRRLARDERVIELNIWAVDGCTAIKVKAHVVDLHRCFPLDEDRAIPR